MGAPLTGPAAGVRLHPDVAAVLATMLSLEGPAAHEVPVEEVRAAHVAETAWLSGPGEPVAEVRDLEVPGPGGPIPVRAFRPAGIGNGTGAPAPAVAYFHGGGWVTGSVETFDTVCRALANAADALVVSVEYRLAPEHPHPAGLEDCLAVTRWLGAGGKDLGADPDRLAVAGDSAGGHLAALVAQRERERLRAQALVYPACDAGLNTPSYREFAEGFGLTALGMRRYWSLLLDGARGLDPGASPARAEDLAGCPPAVVLTAEHDVLRDEAEAYAGRLRDAGVPVELERVPGTIHGFWRWLAVAAPAREAVERVGGALRAALA